MFRNFLVGGVALAAGCALVAEVASAQGRGSPEDQLACTPDVYRLCSSLIPDEDAIVACLKQNVRALSPACRTVMTRPSTAGNGQEDED